MNVRTGNSGSATAGRAASGLAIVLVSALFGVAGCGSANASATTSGGSVTISPDPLAHATATPNTGPVGAVLTQRLCDSITPEVGVTSTPVIDWADQTLYVMALDVEAGQLTYRLHALRLTTGQDIRPSTVVQAAVSGTGMDAKNGTVAFAASDEQQRMGLTLDDGVVYAGFSSWCGLSPYHGWVLGFRAADLSRAIVYNTTPDGDEGGLWNHRGRARTSVPGHRKRTVRPEHRRPRGRRQRAGDDAQRRHAQGRRFVHAVRPVLPLPARPGPRLRFAPGGARSRRVRPVLQDRRGLRAERGETRRLHAAGQPVHPARPHRRGPDQAGADGRLGARRHVGTWGYWHADTGEFVYGSGASGRTTQWRLNPDGTIAPTPVARAPLAFDYPGAVPAVSSDGGAAGSGIVWTIDQTDGATLRAFDAANIGDQLWSSAGDPGRDGLDDINGFDHFDVPTVADGLVFVGDQNHLEIYGLLS